MKSPGAKVECEVHDGREPILGLRSQHRAVAQRGGERHLQNLGEVGLGLAFPDRRV